MIQLNFLNAVAEDDGSGLIVNGKELTHVISLALGTIKRIPGRYDYLKTEDRSKPFKSKLCNVSVTIDNRSTDITETITFDDGGKLLKDLPILNVSKDRLYRWLKSLTDSHVLEHYTLRNQDGTFSLYRFGDNYEALLGYGDIEENVAPVESEEKPKAEKTTKKRSYSEVFEAEENVYIKEALSKWLKVCKDRGVKFNIRTVKKWAETLRKEAKENPTVALKIVDQSVENAWNNL